MPSKHDMLPSYLPSPARRAPTQEFDYKELVADPRFHEVVDEHAKNGFFSGIEQGTPDYTTKLKEIAVAYVGVVNEKRATLFRNRGILNGRRGAFREAISCYNRALELSNNSCSRHVTLANRSAAFIKSQKFAEALEDAQEAACLCPDYSIAHSLMGYCHSRLGMNKKALVNFHMALELNPADSSSEELLEDTRKALVIAGVPSQDIQALEAPFLAKRAQGQEQALTIEGAPAARAGDRVITVKNRWCSDSPERAGGVEELPTKQSAAMSIGGGAQQAEKAPDQGMPTRSSPDGISPTKHGSEKSRKLGRKLSSGSAQAFASLTRLPGKLKHAIGKKTRGRSGSSPTKGDPSARGYGGGDGDGARSQSDQSHSSIGSRAASGPLNATDTCATGEGGAAVPSAGDGGRAKTPNTRGQRPDEQQRQDQQQQDQRRRANRGRPPETPPRTMPSRGTTGDRGSVGNAVMFRKQQRLQGKGVVNGIAETEAAAAASRGLRSERSGLEASPSASTTMCTNRAGVTNPSPRSPALPAGSKPHQSGSTQKPLCPPAPRLGPVQPGVTPAAAVRSRTENAAAPHGTLHQKQRPPSQQQRQQHRKQDQTQQGFNRVVGSATTTEPNSSRDQRGGRIVSRLLEQGWRPEKRGYASSESDVDGNDFNPVRSRNRPVVAVTGATMRGVGGGEVFPPPLSHAVLPDSNEFSEYLRVRAAPIEKAGWTTSESSADGHGDEGGGRSGLDASAPTQTLMQDRNKIQDDGGASMVMDGDSDCGSAFQGRCVPEKEDRRGRTGGQREPKVRPGAQGPTRRVGKKGESAGGVTRKNANMEAGMKGTVGVIAECELEHQLEDDQTGAINDESVAQRCLEGDADGGGGVGSGGCAKDCAKVNNLTQRGTGIRTEGVSTASTAAAAAAAASVGRTFSSMLADPIVPNGGDTVAVPSLSRLSVRAQIEMYERSTRSLSEGDEAKLKRSMCRLTQPRHLSRSLSEKWRPPGGVLSSAITPGDSRPVAAFGDHRLTRSQSVHVPAQLLSALPTGRRTSMTDPIVAEGRLSASSGGWP